MSYKNKAWQLLAPDEDLARELSNNLRISPILAKSLINRGVRNLEEAKDFLGSPLESLLNPFLLKDINKAVRRIKEAIKKQELILVFGDHDVDGLCSLALMQRLLGQLKAKVTHFVGEGDVYSLTEEAIQRAKEEGVRLIISVDCGIGSAEEIALASSLEIDTIVIDHHEPGEELPKAYAIVDPKQKDCPYPFKDLAGVGVAFKVGQALIATYEEEFKEERIELNTLRMKYYFSQYLDLVALGTISDMVPLLGENRILVKHGLKALGESQKVGIKVILNALKPKEIGPDLVSWKIAPLLNAAGRMNKASLAAELLITKKAGEAKRLYKQLFAINEERKVHVQENLSHLLELIEEETDLEKEKIIVVASSRYGRSITGLLATRIAKQYHRPAIVLATKEEEANGSARSVEEFDLLEAFNLARELLDSFGGHKKAAGLRIDSKAIPLFRLRINEIAASLLEKKEKAKTVVGQQVRIEDLSFDLVKEIESLAPFGMDNSYPLFLLKELKSFGARRIGRDQSHLKTKLGRDGLLFDAIGWQIGALAKELVSAKGLDLVCKLEINEYNGSRSLRLNIEDISLEDQSMMI